MMNAICVAGVFCLIFNYCLALQCYTCSVSRSDLDQRCVTDPDNVEAGEAISNCNKAYCTSTRIEYLDSRNVVQGLIRTCTDNPANINSVVEDDTFRIYYVACQTDLCNGGNGKSISSNSLGSVISENVLLVPGNGFGNSVHFAPTSLMICCIFYLLFENIF